MRETKFYTNPDSHQFNVIENQRFNYPPATIIPYGKGWQYNINVELDEESYPSGETFTVYYATSYRVSKKMPLNDIINGFIRCFYTVDDEFACQRQRDIKPEKFKAYNEKVTQIIEISEKLYKKF